VGRQRSTWRIVSGATRTIIRTDVPLAKSMTERSHSA
jgi:hypothetical protein